MARMEKNRQAGNGKISLSSEVTSIKGIGPKTAQKFASVGIRTVEDLLYDYPRAYDAPEPPQSVRAAADGRKMAVLGSVAQQLSVRHAGRYEIVTGLIQTQDGNLPVTWFQMAYLRSALQPGVRKVFRGTVRQKGKQYTLVQPQIYDPGEYERLCETMQPVYHLGSGLSAALLRKAILSALEAVEEQGGIPDYLPEQILRTYSLPGLTASLRQIHFPADQTGLSLARRRLVFDEFLLFILSVRRLKESLHKEKLPFTLKEGRYEKRILASLPYELTPAQQRVWQQVKEDLLKPVSMTRLIQGDVGSGKTIIAFLALMMAAENGMQGALMVPTQVLAKQHYEAFCSLIQRSGCPVNALLLTGDLKAAERRESYRRIEEGSVSVIIGTHALIQEAVHFRNLALVITDEQHRFGVRQREAFSCKGVHPHTMVMSATPIPRTLAVILYGDLDLSVIDQLPANRVPVKNCVVDPSWRQKAYRFMQKELALGHQIYVICPMVEESELIEAENVTDYARRLQDTLPVGVEISCLHGRMKSEEKDRIMEDFAAGKIRVLVSTTVIEVGINVPNATVMMIEDAQRFGLAQLHQLRGRVGRGSSQSYCILIDSSGSPQTGERLRIMNESNDGFVIAEKDLKLRGPGDLMGVRQSGEMGFALADVYTDAKTLQEAEDCVNRILEEDPEQTGSGYALLYEKLRSYEERTMQSLNI